MKTDIEQPKKKKKDSTLTTCQENVYVTDKLRVRDGIGLTESAKILVE